MIGSIHEDYRYRAIVYTQKALEKQIEHDIKTMTYTLLRTGSRKLVIDESKEKFDTYSHCKYPKKQFCPARNKRFKGIIKEYDKDEERWIESYTVYSDSELGIYLEVLDLYLGRKVRYPALP